MDTAAAKKRCEAATPEPWTLVRSPHSDKTMIGASGGKVIGAIIGIKDAEFIAHAREDLPAALGERDAALEALEEAQGAQAKSTDGWDKAFREVEALAKRFLAEREEAQGKIDAAIVALLALSPRPGLWRLKKILAILRGSKEGE